MIDSQERHPRMINKPDSTEELKEFCSAAGFEIQKAQRIKDRVYQATLVSQQLNSVDQVFIKFYQETKYEDLQEFVNFATAAGHPECQVINGNYLCLIMGAAQGRPLSQLLPIVFLPGLWRLRKKRYKSVYFQIGKQLGQLHSKTKCETVPLLRKSSQQKALQRTKLLNDEIPTPEILRAQRLLEEARKFQVPAALTYLDRAPHNIYFDGQKVTQIDFACTRRSIVYDHASVLMGLRLMHGRLRYPRPSIRETLENEYWRGYRETGVQPLPEQKVLSIRYLALCLNLLEFYHERTPTLSRRAVSWLDTPIICREIRRTVV